MSGSIDIRDLDKVQLLKNLWIRQTPASFFEMSNVKPPQFNQKLAYNAVKSYIDYFQGRCIKTDLSHDYIDPYLYDRDAGKGAFEKVVKEMRK